LASGVHFPHGVLCVSVARIGKAPVQTRFRKTQIEGIVKRLSDAPVIAAETNCAQQLARFFPNAPAIRMPVQVTALRAGSSRLREATVVEYCGPEHAIFLSTLPLEFDDRVKLERDRRGRAAEAAVIAVQYHEGRKAVAVRFLQGPCDWMMEP
jgi:hypothetical protein